MSKFKIGDVLTVNQKYLNDAKRLKFKNNVKDFNWSAPVLDIYDDGEHPPIYYFSKADKYGNRDGLAEWFVQLAE